jgi:hypothetical protein
MDQAVMGEAMDMEYGAATSPPLRFMSIVHASKVGMDMTAAAWRKALRCGA